MAGARDRDAGETSAMIFEGASISQLVKIFGMDARDVSEKMRSVQPCGERRGFPIWAIRDAAPALIPPEVSEEDILHYIAGMNFKNLPAALNKEVWNGLRARLRFEQEQGDLWRTEVVQTVVGKLMQTTRMGILLLPDRMNREESLTPKQREAAERIADSLLEDLQQMVVEAMSGLTGTMPGIMDYTAEDKDIGADDELEAEDAVPPLDEAETDL